MTRYSIGPTDRITIDGLALRLVRTTDEGWIFRDVADSTVHISCTTEEYAAAKAKWGFRREPGYFDEKRAAARLESGVDEFHELGKAKDFAAFNWGFARDFIALRKLQKDTPPADKADRVAKSERGLKAAIRLIVEARRAGAVDAGNENPGAVARKPRAGRRSGEREAPCPRTLKKYVGLVEKFGCPTVTKPHTDECGGGTRIAVEVEALMARHVAGYASRLQPKVAKLILDLEGALCKENARRVAEGEPVLPMPSASTFYRRVWQLHAWTVAVARDGLEQAEKDFGPNTAGLGASRPGEFVLIDEFRVPMILIYVASGAWDRMSRKERKRIEKVRPWACVAMDAATRVVLGMTISRESSTASVLATLRMVVSEKSAYADAVGALSPWDMACVPEVVMTDAGSNFVSDPTRAALMCLRIVDRTGPAARPVLRALIERLFGTMHTQLIARFDGRTFANVVARGDYDAGEHASLTPDELAWALVRYVVDVYHNAPHDGLGGETPAACWKRKCVEYPPRDLPDRHTLRHVFGIEERAKTDPSGIRCNGLRYHGKELVEHFAAHRAVEVPIKHDPEDLGGILARLDGRWVPLRCTSAGFDGRSLATWKEAHDRLAIAHAAGAAVNRSVLLTALEEIEALSRRGIKRIGLGDVAPSRQFTEAARARLEIGWIMPGDEQPRGEDGDLLSGGIRSMPASAERAITEPMASPAEPTFAGPAAERPRADGASAPRSRRPGAANARSQLRPSASADGGTAQAPNGPVASTPHVSGPQAGDTSTPPVDHAPIHQSSSPTSPARPRRPGAPPRPLGTSVIKFDGD